MTNTYFQRLYGNAFNASTFTKVLKYFKSSFTIYCDDALNAITDGKIVLVLRDERELFEVLKTNFVRAKACDLSRIIENHVSRATGATMTKYAYIADKKHIARLFTGTNPVLINNDFLELIPFLQTANFSSTEISLVSDCGTFFYIFLPIEAGNAGDKLKKAFAEV